MYFFIYSPPTKGGTVLMVSEEEIKKVLMAHTSIMPTINFKDESTVFIFWLIRLPDPDSLNSIKESLEQLEEIAKVSAEHIPRCELAAFIVHLKTNSAPDFAPDP